MRQVTRKRKGGRPKAASTYIPKEKPPTPYLSCTRIIKHQRGVDEKGKPIFETEELWNTCPWDENIRIASDECAKCPNYMRHKADNRYPSFTIVCKRYNEEIGNMRQELQTLKSIES